MGEAEDLFCEAERLEEAHLAEPLLEAEAEEEAGEQQAGEDQEEGEVRLVLIYRVLSIPVPRSLTAGLPHPSRRKRVTISINQTAGCYCTPGATASDCPAWIG